MEAVKYSADLAGNPDRRTPTDTTLQAIYYAQK
jgi:hypothetical protein